MIYKNEGVMYKKKYEEDWISAESYEIRDTESTVYII